MVNRNLRQIADQVGGDVIKKAPHSIKKITGYEYIPSLKLYVSEEIPSWSRKMSWLECKKNNEEYERFMLSPSMFWKFYDHCKEKRPDIIENLKEREDGEYLDSLLFTEKLTMISNVKLGSLTGTDFEYRPIDGGNFNRDYISDKHGYPLKTNKVKGEFKYRTPRINGIVPCVLTNTINRNPLIDIIALGFSHQTYENNQKTRSHVGFRPCIKRI